MIDQLKLLAEIEKNAAWLFTHEPKATLQLIEQWTLLSNNHAFLEKVVHCTDSLWSIPLWQGAINEVVSIEAMESMYYVISVDGSQIYPDRHIKASCFLLNMGLVAFEYRETESSVAFEAIPLIFPLGGNAEDNSVGVINGMRHEQELVYGFAKAKQKSCAKENHWLLFDGSFIFWHLDLQKGLRERFLPNYLRYLQEGYIHKIAAAAYISDPKSKELISILRLFLCDFATEKKDTYAWADDLVDAFLVQSYVPVGFRTTVFQNRSPISHLYPTHLKPHFFYINLGHEVARVEFPAWMACKIELINALASCVKDQVEKGDGYPVCLAEAHEQAVVKSADRDFFYTCLEHIGQKYGSNNAKNMQLSQKLLHKKMMKV